MKRIWFEKENQRKKPVNRKKEWLEWLQIFAAAAVIATVLNCFIIANSRVPTGSMQNTIMAGSRIIGSRLSYIT